MVAVNGEPVFKLYLKILRDLPHHEQQHITVYMVVFEFVTYQMVYLYCDFVSKLEYIESIKILAARGDNFAAPDSPMP